MDPLVRRKIGRTKVEVTQLGFGGAGLGDLSVVVEDADAAATLQAVWDAGIRYYDTSPWYGRGQSEHRFGRALYRRPRADYVLSTKVGRLFRSFQDAENFEHGFWRGGLKFQHHFDYSHGGVMRSDEPTDWIATADLLDEMLRVADVLVISAALTTATEGLIGARELGPDEGERDPD